MNKNTLKFVIILLAVLPLSACNKNSQKHKLDNERTCIYGDFEMMKSSTKTLGDLIDTTEIAASRPIYNQLLAELDSTDIYDDSILYGYWFQPHAACIINIFLHKDNTYEFKYCENGKGDEVKDILKTGKYSFNGEVITLTSDEGWDSYFNGVIYYKHNGTCYYLTDKKDGFYLVKGSD